MQTDKNNITNSDEQKVVNNQNDPLQDTDNQDSNTKKDPDEWITGSEPMTGAQKSYLKTLSDEAGEQFPDNLTKAEASKKIESLQQKTGRGIKKD